MIDLHSHILAGIDDGPNAIAESVEMARAAVAAGTTTMVATPHVSWRYPNDPDTIRRLVGDLSSRLGDEGLELDLRAGAEVAVTRVPDIPPEQLARLTLGQGPWILLEFPFSPVARGLTGIVTEIQDLGHRVLLAHPERCPAFQRDPAMLRELIDQGALASVTAGSLVGRFGEHVRRFSLQLFRDDLVHNVASDAHDPVSRPTGVGAELHACGLDILTQWLTEDIPRAILEGGDIPPRPAVPLANLPRSRGRWWRRRLGG